MLSLKFLFDLNFDFSVQPSIFKDNLVKQNNIVFVKLNLKKSSSL